MKYFKFITTRKGIVLVVIPLFALFVQGFIRFILCVDFNTIGITLGALGLGQILPFIHFDHFIANKILGISPEYSSVDGKLTLEYKIRHGTSIDPQEIDSLRNKFFLAIFFSLGLFMLIVYLGIIGEVILHIVFGAISCLVSWILLLK